MSEVQKAGTGAILPVEANLGACADRRSFKRVRLAPATMSEKEVRKIAAEYLRPLNQGLQTIGSATNFQELRGKDLYTAEHAIVGRDYAGPIPGDH